MKQYNTNNLKRITKTTARKLYNEGHNILFIPCNLNPENNFYCLGIWEHKELDGQYKDFEILCNNFEWYNCNAETGRYIAFYISTEWHHIEFINGSNPYICKTIKELNKFRKKYILTNIKKNFWKAEEKRTC